MFLPKMLTRIIVFGVAVNLLILRGKFSSIYCLFDEISPTESKLGGRVGGLTLSDK